MKPIINTWFATNRLVHIETNPSGLVRIEAAIQEAKSSGRSIFSDADGAEIELTVDPTLEKREAESNRVFKKQAIFVYAFMLLVGSFAIIGVYSVVELIRN